MDASNGQRFSQLYLKRGEPTSDSVRMRVRYLTTFLDNVRSREDMAKLMRREIGAEIDPRGHIYEWEHFLKTCDLRDLLDSVTLVFKVLQMERNPNAKSG